MRAHPHRMIGSALIVAALFAATHSMAETYNWTNAAGGDFNTAGNWNPQVVPGPADEAEFNTAGTYRVTWSAGITNRLADVRAGTLTFDTGPSVYCPTSFYIAYNSTDRGDVFLTNGTIETRGSVYVGVEGSGNLTITNGAVWRHIGGTGVDPYFFICRHKTGFTGPRTNIVTITGPGSLLRNETRFYVGMDNTQTNHFGAIRVVNGGRYESLWNVNSFNQHSAIEVDGTNSVFDCLISGGTISMNNGVAAEPLSLSITRGGKVVTHTSFQIGGQAGSHATVLIDGEGSWLHTTNSTSWAAFGGSQNSSAGYVAATIRNGGRIVTGNDFENWTNSVITLDDGHIDTRYVYSSGTFRGNGTINCRTRMYNGGVISPGSEGVAGCITVSNAPNETYRQYFDGQYNYYRSGTLEVDLGGTAAGTEYDVLAVVGNVALVSGAYHGIFTARLMNGFRPKDGDTFDILTATGTITPSNDLSGLTFNMPAVPAKTTWSAAVTNIVGGRALRLTAHVAKAGGTVFMVQ